LDFRYIVAFTSAGVEAVADGHRPRAKRRGITMLLLVVAIVAIVGLGLYGYNRTRSAH
jgi:hypothetical protein